MAVSSWPHGRATRTLGPSETYATGPGGELAEPRDPDHPEYDLPVPAGLTAAEPPEGAEHHQASAEDLLPEHHPHADAEHIATPEEMDLPDG